MKATVVLLNAELAEKYLAKNKNNRAMTNKAIQYANEMKSGRWKENGESIIIDTNGLIKDGQHRLRATIIAGHEWRVPVVSDVKPDVMDTIDTGKNRSLSDVLDINGVSCTVAKSAIIKLCIKIDRGVSFYYKQRGAQKKNTSQSLDKTVVTNAQGIDYYINKTEMIDKLHSVSKNLYKKQSVKVFSITDIASFLYLITGGNNVDAVTVNNFLKLVLGITTDEYCAATWFYKKMLKYKASREKVNKKWVVAMCIKCWNLYIEGNPPVTYLNYDIKQPLPKIEKMKIDLN